MPPRAIPWHCLHPQSRPCTPPRLTRSLAWSSTCADLVLPGVPRQVRAILNTFKVWFSLGMEGVPLECVGAVGYEKKLQLWFTAPLVAIGVIVACVYVKINIGRVREALAARRETLGNRHPRTITSLNNLGTLLKAQGSLDEAMPLMREALEASRATLGDSHPDTLASIYNLGLLLEQSGALDDAATLLTEELEGCAARYGADHHETLASARHLVQLLEEPGCARAAEAQAVREAYHLDALDVAMA